MLGPFNRHLIDMFWTYYRDLLDCFGLGFGFRSKFDLLETCWIVRDMLDTYLGHIEHLGIGEGQNRDILGICVGYFKDMFIR
jgi:hypothetical protein